jgi:hypothetical protein
LKLFEYLFVVFGMDGTSKDWFVVWIKLLGGLGLIFLEKDGFFWKILRIRELFFGLKTG